MINKKPLHLFSGVVLILVGALLGWIVARAAFNLLRETADLSDAWVFGSLALLATVSAFCVWMGTREFQRATEQEVSRPRLRWGKMLAGTWIVFFSLKSHIAPSHNALKADNPAEAAGMLMATVLFVLVGLWLIALSFKPKVQDPA